MKKDLLTRAEKARALRIFNALRALDEAREAARRYASRSPRRQLEYFHGAAAMIVRQLGAKR